MLVLNRTIRILLGSGALILVLWMVLLGFTTMQINSKGSPGSSDNMVPLKQKEIPFVEPSSPWRTVDLTFSSFPEAAKIRVNNITIIEKKEQIDTVDLAIKMVVPETKESDVTFIFLHGAAFTNDVWDHLGTLKLFGALGYKCLAIDLPGYGKTTGSIGAVEAKKFVSKVQFMINFLNQTNNMNNVILVAPSMSGHFAIPFALTKPEVLRGLVLIAPAASNIVPQSKLKAFQVPTLLIYGSEDKKMGLPTYLDLRVIPNFQAIVMQGANHAAYIDQPDLFHKYLYNFARKLDGHLQ